MRRYVLRTLAVVVAIGLPVAAINLIPPEQADSAVLKAESISVQVQPASRSEMLLKNRAEATTTTTTTTTAPPPTTTTTTAPKPKPTNAPKPTTPPVAAASISYGNAGPEDLYGEEALKARDVPRNRTPSAHPSKARTEEQFQENMRLGHAWMLTVWGEDQWACLQPLWDGLEGGWYEYADNPGSSAYGIPQALPGDKMGADWRDNPVTQVSWGVRYIKGTYGTPCKALAVRNQKGWY